MGELAEALGGKVPGELIRSDDWNKLIEGIEHIETTLGDRIDAVAKELGERLVVAEGSIATLTTGLEQTKGDLKALADQVEPLLRTHVQVKLSTTSSKYVIGEVAEITAQVTDLSGNVPSGAGLPWVDFVAAWGQLRPVGGFTARGDGNRGISVQVNNQGVAKVQLAADQSQSISPDVQSAMAAQIATTLPDNQTTFAQAVLKANTPSAMTANGGFEMVTQAYEQTGATAVRDYLDAYYQQDTTFVTNIDATVGVATWNEYSTIVLACVKPDADPASADQGLGMGSIQVTFRDWIGPWIIVDYLKPKEPIVEEARKKFRPHITPDYAESVQLVVDDVEELVRDRGVLGRQRQFEAIREALDGFNVETQPPFFNTLTQTLQNAVVAQQAQDQFQVASAGNFDQGTAVFQTLTTAGTSADIGFAQFEQKLTAVQGEVAGFQKEVTKVGQSFDSLDERFQASLAEGGTVQILQSGLQGVTDQVDFLKVLDPQQILGLPGELNQLVERVKALEAH